MEIRLKPETESRLHELASKSGRPADELVEDAMAVYLTEAAELSNLLDSRYDDIKAGRVEAIHGEAFFEDLRQREQELFKRRPPK
jgi:predicted DNA-binding protein